LSRRRPHIFILPSSESTNALARRLADNSRRSGDAVIAYHQRRGRGRFGRFWWSPQRAGLYASWIFTPRLPASRAPEWLMRTALGAYDAVVHWLPHREVRIKWPNDIYVGPRKIAGVLIENQIQENTITQSVVGIGINVYQQTFPPSLKKSATSLALEGARPRSLLSVFQVIDSRLRMWLHAPHPPFERFRGVLKTPLDAATEAALREAR